MLLVKFLNNLFKRGGFILEDAHGKEHLIGKTKSEKLIKMKIHDKKLHYKLLLYPDLYLGEAYTDGLITFKNGDLSAFLDLALENLGRKRANTINEFLTTKKPSRESITNKIKGLEVFELIGKADICQSLVIQNNIVFYIWGICL